MRTLVMLAVTLTPVIGYSQIPVITGAVNAASFAQAQPLSPGSLVSIFGTGLAASAAVASTVPLPNSIEGVSVTFSGTTAPLQYVSLGQINLQVPWNVQTGVTEIVVSVNGTTSSAFRAQVRPASPGIFTIPSGSHQAVAVSPVPPVGSIAARQDSIPGVSTYPTAVGSPLTILATGLGLVAPAIANGAASGDQMRATVTMPTVLVNGSPALVTFSGLSPEFVGVYQINIVVPESGWGPGGGGGPATLQIELGDIRTSDQVTIEVFTKWSN